ncbi:methyl-accepting chemotaxis protein [Rhizobium leguminosarum]|uniref:hypothetical protein n=1 Tax=Rhizobium leguminosarum TaxID=384 RepID=UPI001C929DD4|nr:hypothetical protein [Rhizobium leguminosarum]MBY2968024.1 methyl-accepting chemotaxis protein [Rhizobium leguminosarum]
MDELVKLLEVVAWPAVALVGLVMLGPGGYLLRFADAFGKALSDFNAAMPKLEQTALTMRSSVDAFTAQRREMSETMSKTATEVELRVTQLAATTSGIVDQLTELNEKTVVIGDTVSQIDREKMAEAQQHLASTIDDADKVDEESRPSTEEAALSPDQMMTSIKSNWNTLTEVLRQRSGSRIAFDKRQIGSMAWSLADGRRNNPISREAAELVQELHSQYKRFVRLVNSKDEWLTPAIFQTFVGGVRKAIDELEESY